MNEEFDPSEIEHGFDLIREIVEGCQDGPQTPEDEDWLRRKRNQIVHYLSILIEGRFPERRSGPTSAEMMLSVREMREGIPDLPWLQTGFELMDLYDLAVVDGKWTAFNRKLDEFEKLMGGRVP